MTPREFEQALDHWGAKLEHWPADQAAAARALLAEHAGARDALVAAGEVEAFLQSLGSAESPAPAYLAARIVARAPRRDRLQRSLDWLTGRHWRPAVLAVAVVAIGYLAGTLVEDPVDTELAEAVMSLAFSDLYAEVDDVP